MPLSVTPEPTLTASPTPATAAPVAACRYVFPIRPPSAAGYGRAHHDYPATDMFAATGTDVLSPVDGVIDYLSRTDPWDPKLDDPATRGGLSIAIVGDDGIRYYGSHLRDLEPGLTSGGRVQAGRLLGHVGTSGNARGTGPHLHFGISRPTTPDDWRVRRGEVSPFGYLNAWRSGRAVTPQVAGARRASCRVVSG